MAQPAGWPRTVDQEAAVAKKRGRPAVERRCTRKGCAALALTGRDVCVEHAGERNARRIAREAKHLATERRKAAPLSMTRRAIRMRDDRARDAAVYGAPGRAKFYADQFELSPHKPRPEDDPRNWRVRLFLPGSDDGAYRERVTLPFLSPGIRHLARRRGLTPDRGDSRPAKRSYTGPDGRDDDDGVIRDRMARRT